MFVHAFESLGLPFGWAWFVGTVASILVLTVGLLLTVAYVLLADRKIFAAVQMRRGPTVVGAFGLLQSFADFFKFAFKEVVIPSSSNKGLFLFAPLLTFTLAFIAFAIILVEWVLYGYKMGFGNPWHGLSHSGFFGNFIGQPGSSLSPKDLQGQGNIPLVGTTTFPQSSLVYFQFVFAAITPAAGGAASSRRVVRGEGGSPGRELLEGMVAPADGADRLRVLVADPRLLPADASPRAGGDSGRRVA